MAMNQDPAMLFFLLLAGHALCDFSLQTEFIAKFKDRHVKSAVTMWPYVLGAHSLMHGGVVALITGSVLLGCLETLAHGAIDFGKTERLFGFHVDQGLHVLCKVAWFIFVVRGLG